MSYICKCLPKQSGKIPAVFLYLLCAYHRHFAKLFFRRLIYKTRHKFTAPIYARYQHRPSRHTAQPASRQSTIEKSFTNTCWENVFRPSSSYSMLSCTTCHSLVMYGHFNVALLLLSMWGFTYRFGRSGSVWGYYAYLSRSSPAFSATPCLACPLLHIRHIPCHPSISAPTRRTTPTQTLHHPHTQPPRTRIATDYALRHCDGFSCLIADSARIADSDYCYLRKLLI